MINDFNKLNNRKNIEIASIEYDLRNSIYELTYKNTELENIIKNMQQGFCILEIIFIDDKPVDYMFLKINSYFKKVTGLNNTILNKKMSKLTDKEEFNNWLNRLVSVFKSDNNVITFKQKSKKLNKWYNVTSYKHKDNKIISLFDDITSIINTEERLKKEKEKAEKAERMKNLFLANISHEIRTPMNSILGFSNILLNKKINKENQKKYIGIINNNGEQLLSLLNDIIDISKIEVGELKIHKEHFNLYDIMVNIYDSFSVNDKLKNSNIKYSLDINNINNINIYSDKNRISQILNNLINNSIKFTEDGKISFGCYIIDNNLKCYVKDTGIGIPKEYNKEIFNRFSQIDRDEHSKKEGTGLGLAITLGLIKLLNGNIQLKSVMNKGSIFYFNIPIN